MVYSQRIELWLIAEKATGLSVNLWVEILKKISQLNNTTGYFRVDKQPCKACSNGYIYRYRYHDNDGQHKAIRSVDIEKLQQKVQDKGLEWIKWGDDNNG